MEKEIIYILYDLALAIENGDIDLAYVKQRILALEKNLTPTK